jgi:hypothetical protein
MKSTVLYVFFVIVDDAGVGRALSIALCPWQLIQDFESDIFSERTIVEVEI